MARAENERMDSKCKRRVGIQKLCQEDRVIRKCGTKKRRQRKRLKGLQLSPFKTSLGDARSWPYQRNVLSRGFKVTGYIL